MDDRIARGRADLDAWLAAKPRNYFTSDENLQRVLEMHAGEACEEREPALERTGELAATSIDALARESNLDENLPRVDRFDGIGGRIEQVTFHESYHELGRQIWGSGVVAMLEQPAQDLFIGGLTYLLAHNGEAGHICPVACTSGLIKLLQQAGSEEQRRRYLPRLLSDDYDARLHAAQFVTEVQGGSDVGANDCVAEPDPARPGWYRISGEKWFCSVMDAGAFVMTARVPGLGDGTRGLGIFIVPREIDGELNAFSVRRLKRKLGTRSMASGEADFDGALGEPVGPIDRGFKLLMSNVLDTSRVYNAVAACGGMRRAYVEARSFAAHRRAFDRPIIDHPMVQQILARMRVLTEGAVATTFRLLALGDRIAAGAEGSEEALLARRVHVNINKYWTALACSEVVRGGIEVLGGNGTIEDFSVLPRLYRDTIVLESWEGTHNTLCAQVLRDFAARSMHRPWLAEVRASLERLEDPALGGRRERADALFEEVADRIERLLGGGAEAASLHVRQVVDRMCVLNTFVSLLLEAQWTRRKGLKSDKLEVVDLYQRLVVEPVDPMAAPEMPALYEKTARGGLA